MMNNLQGGEALINFVTARFANGGGVTDYESEAYDVGAATTSNTAASEDIGTSDVDGRPSATTRAAASEDIGADANAIEKELDRIRDDQGEGGGSNFGFNLYSDEGLERSKTELESRPLESQRVEKLAALDKVLDERRKESASEGSASLVENIFDNLIPESPIDFFAQPEFPAGQNYGKKQTKTEAALERILNSPSTMTTQEARTQLGLGPQTDQYSQRPEQVFSVTDLNPAPAPELVDAEDVNVNSGKVAPAASQGISQVISQGILDGKKAANSKEVISQGILDGKKAANSAAALEAEKEGIEGFSYAKNMARDFALAKKMALSSGAEIIEAIKADTPGMLGDRQIYEDITDSNGNIVGGRVLEPVDGNMRVVNVYANGPGSKDTPEMAAQYKELFETQDIQNSLDARGEGKDEREALGLASLAAEAKKPVEPIKPKTIQIPRFTARDFAAFSPTGMYSNKGIPGVLGETR